jgi:hypothetical protein
MTVSSSNCNSWLFWISSSMLTIRYFCTGPLWLFPLVVDYSGSAQVVMAFFLEVASDHHVRFENVFGSSVCMDPHLPSSTRLHVPCASQPLVVSMSLSFP